MTRHATQDEEVGEHVDDVDGLQLARHPDRQALTGEFVDHVEHLELVEHPDLATVGGAVLHEVVGPYVTAVLGTQANARAVVEPQPPLLRLLGRDLQPFAPLDALNLAVVHQPSRRAQQGGDPTITVAAVLPRQLDDVGREPLGDGKVPPHMLDANAPTRGAETVPEPASFRISLSRVRSATALRSRVFSVSRSFSRLTWSDFRPPNSWRQRSYVTSVTAIERIASATLRPCDTSTSTCRSFTTSSPGLCLFLAMRSVLFRLESHTSGRTTAKGEDQDQARICGDRVHKRASL